MITLSILDYAKLFGTGEPSSMIQFSCPYCHQSMQVTDQAAGMTSQCVACRSALVVPVPENFAPPMLAPNAIPPAFGQPTHSKTAIHVQCKSCFVSYTVRDNLIGKTIRCKRCQSPIRIPQEPQPKAQTDAAISRDFEDVMAEESHSSVFGSFKPNSSVRKKTRQFQFTNWLATRSLDQYLFWGCVVVLVIQAVLGLGSLGRPDWYSAYYGSILYLAGPTLLIFLVLSFRVIAPDETLNSVVGKTLLAFLAGIALVFISRWSGLGPRFGLNPIAFSSISWLILILSFASTKQRTYFKNSIRHPVVFAIPLTVVISIVGFIAHFFHESFEGHNFKVQEALFKVAPFLKGL